jgi:tetratricopeptide (TPR) repeat protein
LAEYDLWLQYHPQEPSAYYGRGTVRAAQGDREGAVQDFSQVLSLNPNSGEAWFQRGLVYSLLGQTAAALEDARRAAQIFHKQGNTTAYHRARGLVAYLQKK